MTAPQVAVGGSSSATSEHVSRDVGEQEHAETDREIGAVARCVVVDRANVAAGEVTDTDPCSHPERGTDRVEDEELGPADAAEAGDDAVGLAEPSMKRATMMIQPP